MFYVVLREKYSAARVIGLPLSDRRSDIGFVFGDFCDFRAVEFGFCLSDELNVVVLLCGPVASLVRIGEGLR
jgi:hypothetical protein